MLSNLLAHNGMNIAVSLVSIVLPVQGSPQWRLVALGGLSAVLAALL